MTRLPWSQVVSLLDPHVVQMSTRRCSGSGFLSDESEPKSIWGSHFRACVRLKRPLGVPRNLREVPQALPHVDGVGVASSDHGGLPSGIAGAKAERTRQCASEAHP